jgi:hypothetical protein
MPSISVVVASKVGPPFIDQCLDSLKDETRQLAADVVVVAAGTEAYASGLAAKYPWARVIHSPQVSKVPALRGLGVDAASGELVAVIEEHCSAKEDWLHQALRAHSTGDYGAVGGPVVDYNYPRVRDWVVYFLEYNGSLPPVAHGETTDLNDANIVYRRPLLIQYRHLLDEGYWPMTLHATLLAKGIKLLSAPDMVVYHRGPFDFGYYLRQRFLFSRAFAGVRAQSESMVRRLAYLVGAPLVFVMLLARITSRVVQKRRRVVQYLRTLPLMVPALVVMVAGEWVGCLIGPGDALSKVE